MTAGCRQETIVILCEVRRQIMYLDKDAPTAKRPARHYGAFWNQQSP